jgi:hypothetical protein
VLIFEPSSIPLDVFAPPDLAAFLHVLHRKQFVVLVAHVAQAKVRGGAVRGGGQHHLHHDSRDIEFLLRFSPFHSSPFL